MWKLKLYDRSKLLLAFEYGLTIARTAHEMKVELTPEIIERAEKMVEGEFTNQTPEHIATHIVPNILSVFELDLSK